MSLLQNDAQHAVHRGRVLDAHHVDARDHHLPDDGVPELEDGVNHLPLIGLDDSLFFPHAHQQPDFLFGDQRRGEVDAPAQRPHQQVADQRQHADCGRKQDRDPGHRAAHPEREPVGVLGGKRLGGDLTHNQQGHRHRHHRQPGAPAGTQPLHKQRRRQDRGAHVHDVVADRQGGQDAPRLLLEQAAKLAGATIPVVAEPPQAKLVRGQQGGLRGREEGRQQQQQHQDEPAVRIARGLQRGPSRPFYRRSIASDYNTHGIVGM